MFTFYLLRIKIWIYNSVVEGPGVSSDPSVVVFLVGTYAYVFPERLSVLPTSRTRDTGSSLRCQAIFITAKTVSFQSQPSQEPMNTLYTHAKENR